MESLLSATKFDVRSFEEAATLSIRLSGEAQSQSPVFTVVMPVIAKMCLGLCRLILTSAPTYSKGFCTCCPFWRHFGVSAAGFADVRRGMLKNAVSISQGL